MKLRHCDSNADKVKLYVSVRKNLAEIYEDEPETFGPASVRESPYKDLDDVNEIDLREYQVKAKTGKKKIERGYFVPKGELRMRGKNFLKQSQQAE